jgi:hypothetical protein
MTTTPDPTVAALERLLEELRAIESAGRLRINMEPMRDRIFRDHVESRMQMELARARAEAEKALSSFLALREELRKEQEENARLRLEIGLTESRPELADMELRLEQWRECFCEKGETDIDAQVRVKRELEKAEPDRRDALLRIEEELTITQSTSGASWGWRNGYHNGIIKALVVVRAELAKQPVAARAEQPTRERGLFGEFIERMEESRRQQDPGEWRECTSHWLSIASELHATLPKRAEQPAIPEDVRETLEHCLRWGDQNDCGSDSDPLTKVDMREHAKARAWVRGQPTAPSDAGEEFRHGFRIGAAKEKAKAEAVLAAVKNLANCLPDGGVADAGTVRQSLLAILAKAGAPAAEPFKKEAFIMSEKEALQETREERDKLRVERLTSRCEVIAKQRAMAEEGRDAAIRERDAAVAEVERLREVVDANRRIAVLTREARDAAIARAEKAERALGAHMTVIGRSAVSPPSPGGCPDGVDLVVDSLADITGFEVTRKQAWKFVRAVGEGLRRAEQQERPK